MFHILLGDEFWQISHGWLQDPTQPHQHQNQGQYDPKNIHVHAYDIKYKFHNFCECLRVWNTRSQPHALKKEAKQTTNKKNAVDSVEAWIWDLCYRYTGALFRLSYEAPCKQTQHCCLTTPNIVNSYVVSVCTPCCMCQPCWELLRPIARSLRQTGSKLPEFRYLVAAVENMSKLQAQNLEVVQDYDWK